MAILSAKYGLIHSGQTIKDYESVMTEERVAELFDEVKDFIKPYGAVVFFKGGARQEYADLIENVCEWLGIRLFLIGYNIMADIDRIPAALLEAAG